MTMNYTGSVQYNNVVGNNYHADNSLGFKDEIKQCFESYQGQGINLATDMMTVLGSPEVRQQFVDNVMESVTDDAVFTQASVANEAFYNNYADRVAQLVDNSLNSVVTESAMIGYAPIVAYNPFFLKKQWISCIFKDVLMTEVPKSPVINLAFEKRYLKGLDGTLYPIPDVMYDDEKMDELTKQATGISIKEDPIAISQFKPAKNIKTSDFFPGMVDDGTVELTNDIHIFKVFLKDSSDTEHEIPCNIRVDVTTHNFVRGEVKYDVMDASGNVSETVEDRVIGTVDFDNGKVSIMSENDNVTKVCLRGKLANRFNQRSLDVIRKVEPLQYTMPESGPRLNSAVTIEDAADALALQKIDVIADNCDVMGRTLADLEDFEIRNFLRNSFNAQEAADIGPHGYAKLTVKGGFDAKPYDGFTNNVTQWMVDSREYFERIIEGMKDKLKTADGIITVIGHPSILRFLQNGINWVFTDETTVSGMKLDYNFGIYTTAQDRVHIISTRYMKEDDGLWFLEIPTTTDLITFKHYKYNMVIDRNYRNPLYTLTPNIMCTHRTLTFEVLPVQGRMTIDGRDLFSPDNLRRAVAPGETGTGTNQGSETPETPGGNTGGSTGDTTESGGTP